jgi:two-component system, chemotaxis family, chemotaxis protein CheY
VIPMSGYKSRALVVDDSFTMTSILSDFLTVIGFAYVDRALNGSAALKELRARSYDLVVCDYVMSPMSGPELRAAMDASETLRDIPFLLVTAQAPTSPLQAIYPDLCDFALKPFSVDVLRDKVERLLEAKNRRDALKGVSQI